MAQAGFCLVRKITRCPAKKKMPECCNLPPVYGSASGDRNLKANARVNKKSWFHLIICAKTPLMSKAKETTEQGIHKDTEIQNDVFAGFKSLKEPFNPDDLSHTPVFEIADGGKIYRIYANGKVDGFGDDTYIINSIPEYAYYYYLRQLKIAQSALLPDISNKPSGDGGSQGSPA